MENSNSSNIKEYGEYFFIGVKIGLVFVVGFVAYKLLNKFNIFGTSEATEQATKLGEDPAFSNVVTNMVKDPSNIFLVAIHKKFGAKPTKVQLDSLLPNKLLYPKMVTSIKFDVHNTFTPNDATIIFNAFKTLSSQYEVNFFASVYSATTGQDMYGTLDKLMKDSDMEKLRSMINSKPVI